MKKPALLLCCLLLLLLAGCAVDQLQTPAPSSTPAPPSPTPSKTSFWRIVTSTITPDVTSTPTYEVQQQCIEISPEMPEEVTSNGTVVFGKDRKIYLLDMTTGILTQMSLPNEKPLTFDISPNRKYIAISNVVFDDEGELSDTELVIANARGERLKTIPWHDEWSNYFIKWIDDQHIQLHVRSDANKNVSIWKFNPFTEEQHGIKLNNSAPGLGNFHEASSDWHAYGLWRGLSAVWYDPEFTLTLYPQNIEGDTERFTYHLWNITEQRLVTSLESILNTYTGSADFPKPDWSPDGTQFALTGLVWNPTTNKRVASELYIFTPNGHKTQMTNLAQLEQNIVASSPSWSPDGRYIAMHLEALKQSAFGLAVVDTRSLQLTNYCLAVYNGVFYPLSPLWSPDGKQLLLIDYGDYNSDEHVQHSRAILVDLESGSATTIAEDMMDRQFGLGNDGRVGWMAAPEE